MFRLSSQKQSYDAAIAAIELNVKHEESRRTAAEQKALQQTEQFAAQLAEAERRFDSELTAERNRSNALSAAKMALERQLYEAHNNALRLQQTFLTLWIKEKQSERSAVDTTLAA